AGRRGALRRASRRTGEQAWLRVDRLSSGRAARREDGRLYAAPQTYVPGRAREKAPPGSGGARHEPAASRVRASFGRRRRAPPRRGRAPPRHGRIAGEGVVRGRSPASAASVRYTPEEQPQQPVEAVQHRGGRGVEWIAPHGGRSDVTRRRRAGPVEGNRHEL